VVVNFSQNTQLENDLKSLGKSQSPPPRVQEEYLDDLVSSLFKQVEENRSESSSLLSNLKFDPVKRNAAARQTANLLSIHKKSENVILQNKNQNGAFLPLKKTTNQNENMPVNYILFFSDFHFNEFIRYFIFPVV
jgi:hypothetical protein